MPEIKSLNDIYLILVCVVPGLIIIFVRSQFIVGRRISHTDATLTYLVVTVIYYAFSLPVYDHFVANLPSTERRLIWWIALVFVCPAIVGGLLGLNAQRGFTHTILRQLGLNPVHVIPTAWDWRFTSMLEQWVLVTLKDGTQYAGYCGRKSFMSSDPAERDLYVEQLYDIDDQNQWIERPGKGLLVTAGEIRTIEFWPVTGES